MRDGRIEVIAYRVERQGPILQGDLAMSGLSEMPVDGGCFRTRFPVGMDEETGKSGAVEYGTGLSVRFFCTGLVPE